MKFQYGTTLRPFFAAIGNFSPRKNGLAPLNKNKNQMIIHSIINSMKLKLN